MATPRWMRRLLGRPASAPRPPAGPTPRQLGDRARDREDWPEAARQYAIALIERADDAGLRVQYGHVLKEDGRLAEAEAAYRAAIDLAPLDPDPPLHLGHVLKTTGRRAEATDAYARSLERDPTFTPARDELIAIGGRARLPGAVFGPSAGSDRLAGLNTRLAEVVEVARDWVTVSTWPIEAYDAFRHAHPIAPPPVLGQEAGGPLVVLIDGRGASPAAVRLTLLGLIDQRDTDWTAVVRVDASVLDHPVASLGHQDHRIQLIGQDADAARTALTDQAERPVILTDAGVRLDREALGWLRLAAVRTGACAVYADHDHHHSHWRRGRVHSAPVLQPMPDRFEFASSRTPPALVLLSPDRAGLALDTLDLTGPDARRAALLALADRRIAHLPRLLASVALADDETAEDRVTPERSVLPPAPEPLAGRLLVVIPTRDEPDMLKTCVESLIARADGPSDLDIVVLDNRSTDPRTAAVLADLAQRGLATHRPMDEPFNWARFNNLAVADHQASGLVFANNDVEALSPGWDTEVRQALGHADVGVVGARLLYPDGSIQHAGVGLGATAERRAVHEGLTRPGSDAGPLARWDRPHLAAAVTGAFMAVRRDVFEVIGGFDAHLAIAYNDVELCLRARAKGFGVLYAPSIVLTHHESLTRGSDSNPDKRAWDEGELALVFDRWGTALFDDPARNPQWVSENNRVFDGLRDLSLSQVLDHLDRSARPAPFSIAAT